MFIIEQWHNDIDSLPDLVEFINTPYAALFEQTLFNSFIENQYSH
jgi:hypothetical protein